MPLVPVSAAPATHAITSAGSQVSTVSQFRFPQSCLADPQSSSHGLNVFLRPKPVASGLI